MNEVEVLFTRENSQLINSASCTVRVYKRRWFMSLVLGLINFGNGALWISYSAISDVTAKYYGTSSVGVLALSSVFIIIMLIFGLPAIWLMQRIRLRGSLLVAAWFNCLSGVARVVSSMSLLPQSSRFPILMIGQVFGAFGQPFCLFATTELANLWFPPHERAKANTLTSLSNPLGIVVANLLAPALVSYSASSEHLGAQMFYFNLSIAIPTFLTALICTLGVWSSKPPTPPTSLQAQIFQHPELHFQTNSQSIGQDGTTDSSVMTINETDVDISSDSEDGLLLSSTSITVKEFLMQLKMALRKPPFLYLLLCFGTALGVFTSLSTEIGLLLCSRGYSDSFAGLCGALLIVAGFPGSAIVGFIVDKTRLFLEVVKICFGIALIGGIAFVVVVNWYDQAVLIVCTICWFSLFGLSMYATSLELGVEITYPLPETYSTGLLLMASQLFSLFFLICLEVIAQPLTDPSEIQRASCISGETSGDAVTPKDYRWAGLFVAGFACIIWVLVVYCLRTPYLRQEAELRAKEKFITSQHINDTSSHS